MKKLTILTVILFAVQLSFGQIFSWGVKAGLNSTKVSFDDFSVQGDFTVKPEYLPGQPKNNELLKEKDGVTYINPKAINAPALQFTPSSYEVGFHAGIFTRFKILGFFLQPELYYSNTSANIDISQINSVDAAVGAIETSTAKVTYNNVDLPILVGVKLGPFRLNGGPVATFKLSNNVSEATDQAKDYLTDMTSATNNATFGGQAGVGLDILKKVTLDVRYEFPLSKLGENVTIGEQTFNTDQRQSQFLLSLGWIF